MVDDIIGSILWGLMPFIFALTFVKTYLIALAVLIVFSVLNYWIRINIKEFLKSYFLISFIIFFIAIAMIFYLTYDIENYRKLVSFDPQELEKLSPQEYKVYSYFGFLTDITLGFFAITFFTLPCLLQAYLFKMYSTGEKRKKLSWFIGFMCNLPILFASVYVVYENL